MNKCRGPVKAPPIGRRHEPKLMGAHNFIYMKKILLLAAIALSSLSVKAQTEPGTFTLMPKVGLNMANVTDLEHTKMKAGAVAGVEAEYRASNLMGITAGVHYSMQGVKADEGDGKTKLDYINIPILANFHVWKGLSINAGIQPGFLVSAKADYGEGEDEDIKDECESFDFSIPVGASYEWNSFVLDLRYNIGVTKIYKEDEGSSKNGVLAITLGYKFAL